MDNREDEQLRGITMKSSAIALKFVEGEKRQKYEVWHIKIDVHCTCTVCNECWNEVL